MAELRAAQLLRDIPDFPEPGIIFKDITPILSDPAATREVIDRMVEAARALKPDLVIGIESRGFLFGMPIAMELGVGFAPVRKPGKLPSATIREEYQLEYGTNAIEIHQDAIKAGQRILIVDDLLATGGTAAAAARLVKRLGGSVAGYCFLIELCFLKGRAALADMDVITLIGVD